MTTPNDGVSEEVRKIASVIMLDIIDIPDAEIESPETQRKELAIAKLIHEVCETRVGELKRENEALRAKLEYARFAACMAAIPLEAMRLSGADKVHCDTMRGGIDDGIKAVREMLMLPEDGPLPKPTVEQLHALAMRDSAALAPKGQTNGLG
jgi:hypothetical protein